MNFVVDNRMVPGLPTAVAPSREETADSTLANAFLAARPIDSNAIRDRRRRVTVRVEHVLRSKNRVYLHYSIRNSGKHPYRLQTPMVERLLAFSPAESGPSRRETQVREDSLSRSGMTGAVALDVAGVHLPGGELLPGQKAECVIALDQSVASGVLRLIFAPDRGRRVQAFVVL